MPRTSLPSDALALELRRLDLLLHREILRLRAAYQLSLDEFRGLYVSDAHVDALVAQPSEAPPGVDLSMLAQAVTDLDRACQSARTADSPFAALCRGLELSAMERDLVLLALAPELNAKYETLYAYLNNDVSKRAPTLHLATRLFGGSPESDLGVRAALTPQATLIRSGVLRFADHSERHALLNTAFLLHRALPPFVLGLGFTDPDMPLVWQEPVQLEDGRALVTSPLSEHLASLAQRLVGRAGTPSLSVLHGKDTIARAHAAEAVARQVRCAILRLELAELPASPPELSHCVRTALLAQRLRPAILHVTGFECLSGPEGRLASEMVAALRGLRTAAHPTVLDVDAPARLHALLDGAEHVCVQVPALDVGGRRAAWQCALASKGLSATAEAVSQVAERFPLTWGQIELAVSAVESGGDVNAGGSLAFGALATAARAGSDRELASLSQRLDRQLGWDDLVLPATTAARLREIAGAIAQRQRVYGEWGFARRAGGFGLRVMLAGPSGTGKTLATSVIAHELGLDVFRIDIAQTVSKYIGETEKNLDRIFHAASGSSAILFFDEADALFGKQSEVKEAHDRYSNIEVAYLLQKIEDYQGVLFLATNLSANLDSAFSRRIHCVVEFPLPDKPARERLWRSMFPRQAPLAADIDFDFLAEQFPLAGGDIRNIALDAAFLAAQTGQVIGMKELVLSLSRQVTKQGRIPTVSQFRNYLPLLAEGM